MTKFAKIKAALLGEGEGSSNLNRFMKQKQRLIGVCLLVVLCIAAFILQGLSSKKETHTRVHPHKKEVSVDGVFSTDFTQKNELSALEQQQHQLDRLKKEIATLSALAAQHHDTNIAHKDALLKTINAILAAREHRASADTVAHGALPNGAPFLPTRTHAPPQAITPPTMAAPRVISPPLETIQFHYDAPRVLSNTTYPTAHRRASRNTKTPNTYVPAGTFVRAVLLEGADANASVNGQSDTVGILVRLLDSGTLPNGHHSHLKGCFVLASLYGDISSERGEARLTTLSCTRSDGTILEKKVQGYLSFAGKEGIKGTPVMRNGKILLMAGVSGMLSGFGSALQQSTQTQSISPLGATSTVSPSHVWQNGAYGGASTAMNQLAHYYIQRADQYHPLIEIGSGTVATVIFQRGFSLVDKTTSPSTLLRVGQGVAEGATPMDNATTVANVNQKTTAEIKTLLNAAQDAARSTTSSPFSRVSHTRGENNQ